MGGDSLGELIPVGGGDPIPLVRETMTIGRRELCDICLRFQNVSGTHCELVFLNGYWMIQDRGSSNGTKVNGAKVIRRPLRPGDEIAVATHKYVIHYNLKAGNTLDDVLDEDEDFSKGLLEKSGLESPKRRPGRGGE